MATKKLHTVAGSPKFEVPESSFLETRKLEIVGGPSKFDIMVSLFDERELAKRNTVDFSLGVEVYTLSTFSAVIDRVIKLGTDWKISGCGKHTYHSASSGYVSFTAT